MIEHQWEQRGLLRRHYGTVTAAELQQSDTWLHADPRFGEVGYLIEDLRGCAALVGVDAAELRRSSSAHAARLGWRDGFRHAWVARWPALVGKPAAGAEPEPQQIRTFHFIADARDWIEGDALPCIDPLDCV